LDVSSPEESVIYEIGLDIFKDMENGEPSIRFLHTEMQRHWKISETDEAWNPLVLRALGDAMDDLWRARYARKEAEEARRKAEQIKRKQEAERTRAEEEAEKNARKEHAALARQIAEGLGVTIRHARTLRDEGTCRHERAERIAEITGLDPSDFLRKDHRKRNADLVKLFMTVDHRHVTFTHFLHDEDRVISDETVRVFLDGAKKKFRPGEDFKSLERMIERLEQLGCPLTLESAKTLWRDYKIWRINTISGMARYDVEDE
jgi:hypothetical protein